MFLAPNIGSHDKDMQGGAKEISVTILARALEPPIKPGGLFGADRGNRKRAEVACRELQSGIVPPGADPGFDRLALRGQAGKRIEVPLRVSIEPPAK